MKTKTDDELSDLWGHDGMQPEWFVQRGIKTLRGTSL